MLKIDYKDAMYDGARKYRITANVDGTSVITDETAYTQKGDPFGANDINATNAAINRLNRVIFVTLPADDWTGDTAPYTQTVEAEGITENDIPEVYLYYPDSINETNAEDYVEAYGCINKVETLPNAIKVTAYCDKPSVDITIALRG